MKKLVIASSIILFLFSSCSAVSDMGAPKAWNDEGKTHIEDIHITVISSIINEEMLPQLIKVMQGEFERVGVNAQVEFYDRLALETDKQRVDHLNAEGHEVYGVMVMKHYQYPLVNYSFKLYSKADRNTEDLFYEMMVQVTHKGTTDDRLMEDYRKSIREAVQKLADRDLLETRAPDLD